MCHLLPAFFYETAIGNQPVREWIRGLSMEDRKLIGPRYSEGRIRLATRHAVLSQSRERPVGSAERPDGWKDWAVIFCVARERMVLLHGFVKKTQKTPEQDLKLAVKRMKEVLWRT